MSNPWRDSAFARAPQQHTAGGKRGSSPMRRSATTVQAGTGQSHWSAKMGSGIRWLAREPGSIKHAEVGHERDPLVGCVVAPIGGVAAVAPAGRESDDVGAGGLVQDQLGP